MSRKVGDFLVYGLVVAGILVLTANKNGAGFINALGNVLTGFTGAITGRNVSTAGVKVTGRVT